MACWLTVLMLANCKIPYDPPLKATDTNFLVVEGFIDGAAQTKIKLNRTGKLSTGGSATVKNELNARVLIEDDHQHTYVLTEKENGVYTHADILSLNASYQYRLHIFTSNGKEYLSDFVPFKQSPSIDSIGWKSKDNGVQVYVNTHDPNGTTKYYRWEYTETWEYHSVYNTELKYDAENNTVFHRNDQVYVCWNTDTSTNILLGSSAKLGNDVISEAPIVYIQPHDMKLSVLYSIWVKQYALDVDGYNYLEAMKANTEKIGSIFDPQPNQTMGNIHCTTNVSETIVGYIGAGNSVEKRVFISNNSIPGGWNLPPPQYCEIVTFSNISDNLKKYFLREGRVPVDEELGPSGNVVSYTASYAQCVDCTIRGGANVKPSFWP